MIFINILIRPLLCIFFMHVYKICIYYYIHFSVIPIML